MSDARVVIFDASNSLFPPLYDSANVSSARPDSSLVLQTISNFRSLVAATCQDAASENKGLKVTPVDIGVICDSTAVRVVGRLLYEKVRQTLKEATSSGTKPT